MNDISIGFLKACKKAVGKLYPLINETPICVKDADLASLIIHDALSSKDNCMIARFGAIELNVICNYLGVRAKKKQIINYIAGNSQPWWWEPKLIRQLQINAGFFPPNTKLIEKFCELMLSDVAEVDILGSWLTKESYIEGYLSNVKKLDLELLNPYFSKVPWTHALEGKNILVIHPFAETIQEQYLKRNVIFKDNLLPSFKLKTIKAIQTSAGEKCEFKDWFAALDHLKALVDKEVFDICLIGAGAYGFPLAAHVKRIGKKGFHIGGSLQLLFGIRGKRWENEAYNAKYNYSKLMNEHWVKPKLSETPSNASRIENGCYW